MCLLRVPVCLQEYLHYVQIKGIQVGRVLAQRDKDKDKSNDNDNDRRGASMVWGLDGKESRPQRHVSGILKSGHNCSTTALFLRHSVRTTLF